MQMLIKSQDGELTILGRVISVGKRTPNQFIGEKLNQAMFLKGITDEELVKKLGNSYRDNVRRILNDEEVPSKKLLDKIIEVLETEKDYFLDKEIYNVIITDSNIVIGTYSTNERAKEVKAALDEIIFENYKKGTPIVIEMPKE